MLERAGLLMVGAAVLMASPAAAQSSPNAAEIREIRAQITALNARLDALERAEAPAGAPSPAPAATVASVTAAPAPVDDGADIPRGPVDRLLQSAGGAAQIDAASGSGRASIKVTSERSWTDLDGRPYGWGATRQWTLGVSAPLNDDGDVTDIATLDGFANAFELKLQWSRFSRYLRIPSATLETEARAACRTSPTVADRSVCEASFIDGSFIRTHLDAQAERDYLASGFGSAHAFGFEGRVGYAHRKFLDAATAARMEDDFTPWGVRAFYAYLPSGSFQSSWTGAIEYQEAWEDQDKGVLCPVGPGPILTCLSGAVGAPEREDKLLTSLEWRGEFPMGEDSLIPTVGISAQFTWDQVSDEYGFDLPIYLFGGKGGLTGGVRLGYTSEKDDTTIGLFLGAPFSLR